MQGPETWSLSQKKMSLHPSDAWKQMAVVFGGNPRFYMQTGCSRHVVFNKTPEKVPYFFRKFTVCFVRMGHLHDFCCRTKTVISMSDFAHRS